MTTINGKISTQFENLGCTESETAPLGRSENKTGNSFTPADSAGFGFSSPSAPWMLLPLLFTGCASSEETLSLGNCDLPVKGYDIDQPALTSLMSYMQVEADFITGLVDNDALCQAESVRIEVFDDTDSLPLYTENGDAAYYASGEYSQDNVMTFNVLSDHLDILFESADPVYSYPMYALRRGLFHESGHAVAVNYYESDEKKVWLSTFNDQNWNSVIDCDPQNAHEYQVDCWTRDSDNADDFWGKYDDLTHGMDSAAEDWATTFETNMLTMRSTEMCVSLENLQDLGWYSSDENPTDIAMEKYDYMLYGLAQTAPDGNAADTLLSFQGQYTPPATEYELPASCYF